MTLIRRPSWCAFALGLSLSVLPALAADAPTAPPIQGARPDAYAYGWPLAGAEHAPGAFHRVALSREVRAAAVSPQLADVAVYDDDDRLMPSFLIEPEAERATAPAPLALPLFETVEGMAGDAAAAIAVTARDGNGAEVEVSVGGVAPRPLRRWYALLDGRAVAEAGAHGWQAASFAWGEGEAARVIALELETSDDLQYWRRIGYGALADLGAGATTLRRDRIELDAGPGRYLRFTAHAAPAGWTLTGVALHPRPTELEPRREWFERALPTGGASHDLDLGAPLPVDRFELQLAPNAGVRRARLLSAEDAEGPWTPRAEALFHSIERPEGVARSGPQALAPVRARHWRIEVVGDGVAAVTARLGWRPTDLVFVAQGRAPYRLVAGRATPDAAPTLGGEVRALWRPEDGATAEAELGPRVELAGERARSPSLTADWKRWTLWLLLALGVVGVLAMAGQLLREMKR